MTFSELHDLVNEQNNICQIVAYKNGHEVYSDEWNGFKKSDSCHIMAVTKSIVSILIGIAIDKGFIENVNQRILDFFPDFEVKKNEKGLEEVTIRDLLTMTVPFKYTDEPWQNVLPSMDWSLSALELVDGKSSSRSFRYSTLGLNILTGIITKTSGMHTVDFANKYLFRKLGITSHSCYSMLSASEYREFNFSSNPRDPIWISDPKGIAGAGFGLCLSASDMAKIGQMCLNNGVYEKIEVVSSDWIRQSTRLHVISTNFTGFSYGYLWWTVNNTPIYGAIGDCGNTIYVNPKKKIVIAITVTFKPTMFDRIQFIQKNVEEFVDRLE